MERRVKRRPNAAIAWRQGGACVDKSVLLQIQRSPEHRTADSAGETSDFSVSEKVRFEGASL